MFCCFNSTQFQEFDFLQPTTATTSSVATTSHTQLQTAHWTVAGQMLWHGVHAGFSSVSCLFSNICWDVRWSQENSIEHNKELAAALRWTGDSNMAMSFIGCGPQPRKTMFSLLTPGCNTLESDIKQFALLCEQNVEALWRSVWKFVYQVIMFGYFWPCRFVNCHTVDRSKAWAVVQGRGEASGNHHYQLSWFKQNCVQDTLSPQCFSRFAFRVCKQLLDWESPQAWLSFEPLGRMSISQQIRHLVKSWNWGQQFIQSNSIEFIRGVQKNSMFCNWGHSKWPWSIGGGHSHPSGMLLSFDSTICA